MLGDHKRVDMVLLNGKVVTVDANDRIAEAVAVSDGKIVSVARAKLFLKVIQECPDSNARNIAEISVGTYSRKKSRYTDNVEDVKLTHGAVHIAFVDNHAMGSHPKIRGKIPSILHVDAAELNATLRLDGKTVIDKGKLLY